MSACDASLCTIMKEAEPFETAAVASVREQMVTACNVSASAATVKSTQTSCAPSSCSARRARAAGQVENFQNEGEVFSTVEAAIDMRFFARTVP